MQSLYTRILVLWVALLVCALGHPFAIAAEPSGIAREPKAAKADFPVPILQLRGSGDEIGSTHAKELRDPIRQLFDAYLGRYFRNAVQRNMALLAATTFEPHVLPEHKAEIHALAKGVDLDQRQIMLGQCFLDLSAMTACSTITLPADASPDGIARFGRNLDFPSFNVADKQSVLMIFHPKDRYAFASIAWPGMIGVLSGMNEHGLSLANMEVNRERRLPVAMPYTLLYRTVLEQCKTVDEAINLLQKTPRQTANSLMLMDATGDRAVVEITPEAVNVRRASNSEPLISTNHHRGEDLQATGRCRRFDFLRETSSKSFGRIAVDDVKQMLSGAAQGKMTLQSMVFEPGNRVIYLATGAAAHAQPYHRLDLTAHFK